MSGGLIGSRISLISRKDIRWEGILVEVDRENASVTLQNVRSWGTEDRMPGEASIAGSSTLHDRVSFRGEDIKDLHVHETAEPPPPQPPMVSMVPVVPVMPAVPISPVHQPPSISTNVAPDAAGGGHSGASPNHAQYQNVQLPQQAPPPPVQPPPPPPPPPQPSVNSNGGVGTGGDQGMEQETVTDSPPMMRDQGRKPGRYQPPHKNPNWKAPPTVNRGPSGPVGGPASGAGGNALPGQGNHLLNRRTRGMGGGPPVTDEGEFDFQAGLAKFDKEKEMALLASGMSTVSLHENKAANGNGGRSGTTPGGVSGGADDEGFSGEGGGVETAGEGNGASSASGESGGATSEASPEAGAGTAEGSAAGKAGEGDGSEVEGVSGSQGAATAGAATRERPGDSGEMWVEAPVVVKKYNKASFFDEISCDALDGRNRMPRSRAGERTRNTETFGATSVALAASSRRYNGRSGGGGGYGEGYGGGYSGGGRRGYHHGDDYRQGASGWSGNDYGHKARYGDGENGGARHDSGGSWRRN